MAASVVASIALPISNNFSFAPSMDAYGKLSEYGKLGAWSPLSLFASGEQGAWYDPSDLSTMFQDAAGTTPVTAVGQPVGKILDKSGRGNHASQATAAKRPLLQNDGVNNYLAFDGVDDALATASIDFTATDKIGAFVGVSKTNITTSGFLFESSDNYTANNGSLMLLSGGGAFGDIRAGLRTTAVTERTSTSLLTAATPFVFTAGYSASGPASADFLNPFRKDGANFPANTTGAATPAAAFGNHPVNVGSRNASSVYLDGNIYSLIILGRLATTQEIDDTETWVADKAGVTLP